MFTETSKTTTPLTALAGLPVFRTGNHDRHRLFHDGRVFRLRRFQQSSIPLASRLLNSTRTVAFRVRGDVAVHLISLIKSAFRMGLSRFSPDFTARSKCRSWRVVTKSSPTNTWKRSTGVQSAAERVRLSFNVSPRVHLNCFDRFDAK